MNGERETGKTEKNGEECPVARPSCGFASHPASGFNRIKVPIRNATTIRFPARRRTFPFLPVPLFSPLPLSPIFPAPFLPLHSSLCVSCRFTSPLLPLVSRVFRFPPFVVFFSSVVPSRACSLGEPEGRRDIRVIARLFSVPKDANCSAASVAPPFFLHPLRYPSTRFQSLRTALDVGLCEGKTISTLISRGHGRTQATRVRRWLSEALPPYAPNDNSKRRCRSLNFVEPGWCIRKCVSDEIGLFCFGEPVLQRKTFQLGSRVGGPFMDACRNTRASLVNI